MRALCSPLIALIPRTFVCRFTVFANTTMLSIHSAVSIFIIVVPRFFSLMSCLILSSLHLCYASSTHYFSPCLRLFFLIRFSEILSVENSWFMYLCHCFTHGKVLLSFRTEIIPLTFGYHCCWQEDVCPSECCLSDRLSLSSFS